MLDDLLAAFEPDPAHLTSLVERLAHQALREGLVDVAYRELDSPVGPLVVAATTAGLVSVDFADGDRDSLLQSLADRIGSRVIRAPERLDAAARQLAEYFEGGRTHFDLPLDLRLASGFRLRVLENLALVPFGATTTYSDLAAAAGSPRAVRAAGSACATNPLPIVIGCHRVLRRDGGLGGYAGGLAAKRLLLELEGRRPDSG